MPPGNPDFASAQPDLDSIWKCACGIEMPYRNIVGHRKGWKNRPGCQDGGITFVRNTDGTTEKPYGRVAIEAARRAAAEVEAPAKEPDDTAPVPLTTDDPFAAYGETEPLIPEQVVAPAQASAPAPQVYEYRTPEPPPTTTEDLARMLLLERRRLEGREGPGSGTGTPEFRVERPDGAQQTSEARESVTLPVVVRIIYDWAKEQGWKAGDGSLSAFITDIFLDHWENCMGMGIFIAKREDIPIGSGTGARS